MRYKWEWRLVLLSLIISIPMVSTLTLASNLAMQIDGIQEVTLGNLTVYDVDYDSGDGIMNSATYIYNVTQKNVIKDLVTCFRLRLSISEGPPNRKTNAPIVGTAIVTIAGEEQWRSESDLRLVHKYAIQTNVPIVGTVRTEVYYRNYNGYPGWPYKVGQNWTYEVFYDPDSFLVGDWLDKWSAKVVSDSTVVTVGSTNYTCYVVVHTITSTGASPPPGGGVGSTITEYWIANRKLPVPVKMVDQANFIGREIRMAVSQNI